MIRREIRQTEFWWLTGKRQTVTQADYVFSTRATAGLSDFRNSAPSWRKPDTPQQPIKCANRVQLLRSCALGSGVECVAQQRLGKIKFWSWDRILGPCNPNSTHAHLG